MYHIKTVQILKIFADYQVARPIWCETQTFFAVFIPNNEYIQTIEKVESHAVLLIKELLDLLLRSLNNTCHMHR